ncbi:MAG: M28 family peptidase [Myxococcales bacterium]|nr:M28 family peptidase [Myxococcales bacterium]
MRARMAAMLLLVGCAGSPRSQATQAAHEEIEAIGEAPATPRIDARAATVFDAFDTARALSVVEYADRHFRVRGNEGYVKTLERVRNELAAAGFTALTMPALGPSLPTWTPRAASLVALGPDGARTLVEFDDEGDVDRAALLVRSDPTAEIELEVVTAEAVEGGADARGRVVLAEGDPRQRFGPLVAQTGAAGLLTRNLEPYHDVDAHPDLAQFGYLPEHETPAFGFSLSRQDFIAMQGVTRVRVRVDVAIGAPTAALAVEARIEGTDPAAGAIVFVAHVDEPGANDNGSGVGALTALAIALRERIESGAVPRPRRTIVFLWGQEIEVSQRWLADPPIPVAAGLVLDMVGEDPALGAPFLIERMPDPGAVWLRGDDQHTEWGAGEVEESRLRGHFLNDLMAACATATARRDGPWRWRTNPFEGGSDHEPFLERGLPAVLGWHFTDRAYHTTIDRMDRVSGPEMRRVAATFGAAALTMASDDTEELAAILAHARRARLADIARASAALVEAGRSDRATEARVRAAWETWYEQAEASRAEWR